MFTGYYEHAVDEKGRVSVPADVREVLVRLQDGHLVLTRFKYAGRRCLDAYPASAWETLKEKIGTKNRFDTRMMKFRNVYVSGAQRCPVDAAGRILLPPHLRQWAGIGRDAVITGDVEKVRIWDRKTWQEVFAEDEHAVLDDEGFLASLDL